MRVVAISDLHGYLPAEMPAADLLIIAGDVCPDFPGSGRRRHRAVVAQRQADWLRDRFVPWLEAAGAREVVMCWGNHDYVGELPRDVLPSMPAQAVTDGAIEIAGLRLYATPWTFTIPEIWAFDVPPPRLATYMAAIPDGIDVLITHGPPHGVLDRCANGEHAGSRALLDAVSRVRPRLHVFGHIHEARGQDGTSFNVALLNECYQPYARPVTTIDL